MPPQDILERVYTAWIEGRLENVLERQKQLAALHEQLSKDSRTIVQAVQQDNKANEELVSAELVATLDGINAVYEQLNFQDVLAQERGLKNGGRSASFFAPLGTTLVVQSPSSPIISALGPLTAALAAGSPAIILGSASTPNANAALQQIIWRSLDRESFHFEISVNSKTHDAFAKASFAIAVLSDLKSRQMTGPVVRAANPAIRIIEPYHGLPAGFIDRSAKPHLDAAAAGIKSALAAGASSNPRRVPRLFFVDESVIVALKEKLGMNAQERKGLESWLEKWCQHVVGDFERREGEQRPKMIQIEKFVVITPPDGSEIALVPTTSLDHSIDLLNRINIGTGAQVIYIFAGWKEAFYLGNFTITSQVFINDMPDRAFVLASSRSVYDTGSCPYRFEDFSEMKVFQQGLSAGAQNRPRKAKTLDQKKVQQHKGGKMSYFEQGLILGAAMGLVALTGLSILTYRGIRLYMVR
ncbi:Aldehyde/histidinol dehydrogenase [Paraphoma chrysanthemicola]|uniref:Aldehyde/histidinol dehydrogenase n=1 Tax=Paraphoma chrysanthemicola TaxID=798071 RepID=A0A8K0QRF6_9PLEO|nr:Aldehyde/histidinol dehydrogenase [Paraphoma chrysanthemicola]